ncbi:hypothetical protein ATANTOWER_008087 [Ataeniobius toweri]|uniref:Uncharacterized protein n=1 Tax=Ataeniobius toweri TaxID=208326 RepID=A0ABU7BNE3_9TELE|nr:hypothetical protein [Ataeniobius toweri]
MMRMYSNEEEREKLLFPKALLSPLHCPGSVFIFLYFASKLLLQVMHVQYGKLRKQLLPCWVYTWTGPCAYTKKMYYLTSNYTCMCAHTHALFVSFSGYCF